MVQIKLDFSLLEQCKNDIVKFHTRGLDSYGIADLILDQSFSVVRLNTGWIGISMNYGVIYEGRRKMREETARLKRLLGQDPLLLETLWNWNQPLNSFLRASLQTSLLSALSYPLYESPDTLGFQFKPGGLSLASITQPGDSVTVIGLGGYLHAALKNPHVKRVFLADLYLDRPHAIREIEQLKLENPEKEFLVSDGSQNDIILRESQIACITASSLSNGTLPFLLSSVQNCRAVVLQGKSGNVFPTALFRAGITHVATYRVHPKNWNLIQQQILDHPEEDFSSFIDANIRDSVSYSV